MFMPYFPPPRLRAWRRSRCWRCDRPMEQWRRMMWWCGNCGLLYTYSYRLDDGRTLMSGVVLWISLVLLMFAVACLQSS